MMLEDEADDEEADENDDEAADRVSCCDTVIQSEEDEDANANENENQERDEWQRQRQQQRCANRSSCYTSELATAARQSTPNASERAGGQFSCSIFASKSSSGPGNFRQAKDNNREDEEEETVPRSSSERRNSKDQDFVGDIQESNSRGGAASSGSCSDGGGGAVFEFLDGRREREFGADFKGMPVSGLRYDSFRSGGESDLKRQDATRNSGHSKRFKSDCDSCGPGTSPRQNDQMRQQSFQLSSGRGSPLGVDQVSMANKQLQHRVPSSRLATTACTTTSNYEMADNNSAGGASYKANQTGGAHAETSAVRRHYQLGTRPGLATSLAELHQASITVACPGVDAAAGDDDNDEQGEQGDDEQNGGDDDDDDELGEQTSIGRTEVAASYTNTTATASGADGSYSNEYLRLDSLSDCEARYHCRPTSSASSSSPSSAAATIGLAGGGGGGQGQLITSRQESRGQSATSTTGHQRAAPNQVFACDTARNSNPTSNGNSAQVVVVDVGTSRHCSPDATRRQPLCRRSWQPRIQQQQQQQQQQLEFGAIEQQHSPRSSSRMLPVAQQQHHLSNHLHTSGSGDGEQQQQQQGQLRATFASFAGGGRIEHAPGDGRAASSCASSSSSSLRNKIFERGYEIHIIHPEPAPRQEAIESLVNQSSIGIDNKEKWYKCSTSSTDTNTSDATARLASACLEQVNKCGRGGNQDNKASRQETNSTRDAARTGSATATTGQEYRLTMMIDQSTTTTTSTKQKTTTITPAPTETMTENLKQYPPNHPLGNSKHLCAICGDRATGKHYGVFSCEGCKGFFKRTIRKDIVYVCRAQGCCLIDMRQRNRCQYCRYQKCLTCGMKREAVQEEKQRLKLRAAAAGQQQQSQLQQQQQQQQSQQHQISSDTSNNQNQNHIFNQCDTSADLSQNKLDSSTSMPHYNHYNLEATHNNNDHHHHHHHNHHHHSQLLASSSSSPPSSYRNNCNTSPHIFNATTTTPNSHNNNYDHHPLGPAAIYQQSGFGSSIAPAATTNLRPGMRINELTLKWAAQVQIECLIDWAKSVPKFTGLLIDDQVTLLRAYWNELIIAHIAFKTAEALRDGSMPGVGRHDKLNSLCIGRGIFIDAIQAHEIGLGNMFDRIIDELVVKMRDMRIDANELACLRAIILFNPESHGLKTSQPIEEYRGDIYTTLETYCRRHYEDQPNRFGKLLLRLPALRSIGLKCDSMRPYQQQQQQRRCDNNNINHHHHLVTTSTTHYNNSHHQVPRCSPTGGRGSSSPTSSSVSSISSSTSTTSSSSGMTTTASITTTTGAGAVPASYKFGYQVNLLFFGLCYEMSSIDSFLRESLTLN